MYFIYQNVFFFYILRDYALYNALYKIYVFKQ